MEYYTFSILPVIITGLIVGTIYFPTVYIARKMFGPVGGDAAIVIMLIISVSLVFSIPIAFYIFLKFFL